MASSFTIALKTVNGQYKVIIAVGCFAITITQGFHPSGRAFLLILSQKMAIIRIETWNGPVDFSSFSCTDPSMNHTILERLSITDHIYIREKLGVFSLDLSLPERAVDGVG